MAVIFKFEFFLCNVRCFQGKLTFPENKWKGLANLHEKHICFLKEIEEGSLTPCCQVPVRGSKTSYKESWSVDATGQRTGSKHRFTCLPHENQ